MSSIIPEPQTNFDSFIRDLFSRIVEQQRTMTFDLGAPSKGTIKWEMGMTPTGNPQITVWWVPPS